MVSKLHIITFDLQLHIGYNTIKVNKNNHVTGGNGVYHREHDLKGLSTAWVNKLFTQGFFCFKFIFGGYIYER